MAVRLLLKGKEDEEMELNPKLKKIVN